jgi:hypothetical protein
MKVLKCVSSLIALCAIGVALAAFLPLKNAPLVGIKGDYSLQHVNIVDTISGGILSDMTVLIEQGRISEIIPGSHYQPRSNFVDIPASGKYLLPGLWDMHTHSLKLSPQLHHPLLLRYGITSIRDMSGCLTEEDSYWACPQDRYLWQEQAINGERVAPRYPLQSSYQTNGGSEVPQGYPEYFRLKNQQDAGKLVDFYAGQDVDFIKTYTELSSGQYDNLVVSAARKNIAIAGHKPLSVSLVHALDTGLQSIEHGRLFMFECFEGIESFRQLENPISQYNAQFMRTMLQGQNKDKCVVLMESMASSDTSWVPTLTTLKMSAMSAERLFRQDSRLEYIPYIVRALLWEPDINRASDKGYDQQGHFVHADFYAAASAQVGLAHHLGVKILAGTDNIDTYVFSGASLHDELSMLVEAGLTPLAAIQTATINPARFSDLEHDFGSIEIGKQADVLLLNENPLSDIRHTADIYGVMFAGQYFDKEALEKLDHFAVEMARSLLVNMRFLINILASPLMRAQLAD